MIKILQVQSEILPHKKPDLGLSESHRKFMRNGIHIEVSAVDSEIEIKNLF